MLTEVYIDSLETKELLVALVQSTGFLRPEQRHTSKGIANFIVAMYNTSLNSIKLDSLRRPPRTTRAKEQRMQLELPGEVLFGFPKVLGLSPEEWNIILINIAYKVITPYANVYPKSIIPIIEPPLKLPSLDIPIDAVPYMIYVSDRIRRVPEDRHSSIEIPILLHHTRYTDVRPPQDPDFITGPTHDYANHWFMPWCNRIRTKVYLTPEQLESIRALCFYWHIFPPRGTTNEAIISIVLEALIHHILVPTPF